MRSEMRHRELKNTRILSRWIIDYSEQNYKKKEVRCGTSRSDSKGLSPSQSLLL